MNIYELNSYIKNYIEEDKTQSAIMMTGGWGTGKSYYIHNTLEPFLRNQTDSKHRCAIVSLYGLKNISEISKKIYFELRSIGSSKKSEKISTGSAVAKALAKTVLNGMTNMIGFDIASISDEDLEKVYSSINLENILIVFEDLERSSLDIIEILGYVNNLVEQDGAKVLLVANENEILKYCDSQTEGSEETHKVLDKKSEMYLKAKEKTVSDTVFFSGETIFAIKNIIVSFGSTFLESFLADRMAKEIYLLMMAQRNFNLRKFAFACQKTIEICKKLKHIIKTDDFLVKSIFFGIISFAMKIKCDFIPDWNNEYMLSTELGDLNYPLFRFCYDYIRWKTIDIGKAESVLTHYRKLRSFGKLDLFDKSENRCDKDLEIILNYSNYQKIEILSALNHIKTRLNDIEDVSFYKYEILAYNLIKCHFAFEYDYSSCKENMISNVYKLCMFEYKIDSTPFIWSPQNFSFEDEVEKKMFEDFSNEISQAIHDVLSLERKSGISIIKYLSALEIICYYVEKYNEQMIYDRVFISKINFSTILDMICECHESNIMDFREILFSIYKNAKKGDFMDDDLIYMKKLKEKLEIIISEYSSKFNNTKLLQIGFLIEDLTQYIKELS